MLIDSHCHLNFTAFDEDRDEIVKKCLDNDIWMINVGTKYKTSRKAVEMANSYTEGVFAAIGLHPIHLESQKYDAWELGGDKGFKTMPEKFDYEKYRELARSSKKVVAIGEVGLDYWRKPKTKKKLVEFKEKQKKVLLEQIKLARELDLPIIFHCRVAFGDLLNLLKSEFEKGNKIKGVIHSFTGNWQEAKEFLKMGFYLGLNGIIFKLDLKEVVQKTPLDKMLTETDSPYLIPPQCGGERNEPFCVRYVVKEIGKIRKEPFEKISEITTNNAKDLFNL